jgi:protease-4
MGRGKRATIAASLGPWNDDERAVIRSAMEDVYRVFVGRVAEGRHKQPAEIEPIAQGRVWTGARAKELGLVDEIGGLDAALAEARTLAKVDAATPLEVYPAAPTLRDVAHFRYQAPGIRLASGWRHAGAGARRAHRDPFQRGAATERLVELVFVPLVDGQAVATLPVIQ